MRVNWFKVIDDLERCGVSLRSQAVQIEVSLGSVYYWKNGGEPRYSHGSKLLDLYMRQVGNEPPLQSTICSSF